MFIALFIDVLVSHDLNPPSHFGDLINDPRCLFKGPLHIVPIHYSLCRDLPINSLLDIHSKSTVVVIAKNITIIITVDVHTRNSI